MFPVCHEPGFISLRNRDLGGRCLRRDGQPSWAEIGKQQTQLSSRIGTFSKESPPLTGESRHWLASYFNYKRLKDWTIQVFVELLLFVICVKSTT
jgi:hypothetical protein